MTATRMPRGRYAKTPARRREILNAAVEVFSEGGFRAGSLRDVAERVGLSQAGLLHHYPTKTDLLKAVLAWRDDDARARLDPDVNGVDLFRALVDVVAYNAGTPELVELHVVLSAEATAPNHPAHDYFVARYRSVVEEVRTALERAADDGHLRTGVDCASTARTIVAIMDGLQVQWLLDRGSLDMAEEVRAYLRPLLTVDL